jgi:hypothetical protein
MFNIHIPYLNYLKLMFLYGYPIEGENGIKRILAMDAMLVPPDEYLYEVLNNLNNDPKCASMIADNAQVYESHLAPKINGICKITKFKVYRDVIKSFPMPNIADGMSFAIGLRKFPPIPVVVSRILKLLRTWSDRRYIEMLIMHDYSIGDIYDLMGSFYGGSKKAMPYTPEDIKAYMLYFWNCNSMALAECGNDKMDLYHYFEINIKNEYYLEHPMMYFSQWER